LRLDEKLLFQDHIYTLEAKIGRSIGIMSILKYYVPPSTLKQKYFDMVHSHLSFSVLFGDPPINRIFSN